MELITNYTYLCFQIKYPGFSNNYISSRESIEKFVDMSWVRIFEMRKTESFWIGMKNFVDLICHPYFSNSDILVRVSPASG